MNEAATPKLPRRLGYTTLFLLIITAVGLLVAGPAYRMGLLCFVVGILASVLNLRKGTQGMVAISVLATLVGLGLTLNNLNWFNKARGVPPIHDISTDTVNPPKFVAVVPLRADAPNPVEYAGEETAAKQMAGYPELKTVRLDADPGTVFKASVETAKDLGWKMVAEAADEGRIEATDTTSYFGFKDDVVIRIRKDAMGTAVDVRSKSRVGLGDVGANADRIQAFLAGLEAKL